MVVKKIKQSISLVLVFLLSFSSNVFASGIVDGVMCIDDMKYKESKIMDVVLPTNSNITLDPLQVEGKGQIISDNINLINYSNVDVEVELKSIYYILNDEEIIPMSKPFNNSNTSEKKIYSFLRKAEKSSIISEETVFFESEIASPDDIIVGKEIKENVSSYTLKSANYNEEGEFIDLSEESVISFKYFGMISTYPDESWEDNDIAVKLLFELKTVPEDVDEEASTEEVLGGGIAITTEIGTDEEIEEASTEEILGDGIEITTEIGTDEEIEEISTEEILGNGIEIATEVGTDEEIEEISTEEILGNETEIITEIGTDEKIEEASTEEVLGNETEITTGIGTDEEIEEISTEEILGNETEITTGIGTNEEIEASSTEESILSEDIIEKLENYKDISINTTK